MRKKFHIALLSACGFPCTARYGKASYRSRHLARRLDPAARSRRVASGALPRTGLRQYFKCVQDGVIRTETATHDGLAERDSLRFRVSRRGSRG